MKNGILPLLLLLSIVWTPAFAQNNLTVSDPRTWGGSYQGNIDEAVLEIKPAGAYIEFGLELTLSTQGSHYQSINDTVEAVLNFTLPKGAIIHDSWLWVGQDIMQGLLIERNTATNIYEGIVNRRRDPSLLYKNSPTQYQLRVFPMAGHEPRKVKITYLLPARFSPTELSAQLPFELLRASHTMPKLKIVVHTNATFHTPSMVGNFGFPFFTGPDAQGRYTTVVPTNVISAVQEMRVAYNLPLQNGIFMAYYPQTQQSGYYQLVIDPTSVTGLNHPTRKIMLVLHHEMANSRMTPTEMMYWCERFLLANFSPTDSFNIVFPIGGNNHLFYHQWLPITVANVEAAVNQVTFQYQNANGNGFAPKIAMANDFVRNHGGGELLLLTNHSSSYSNSQVNILLQGILAANDTSITLDVVNYYDGTNGYPYRSEQLFNKVATMFGGNHYRYSLNTDYYGYSYYGFPYWSEQTISDLFDQYNSGKNTLTAQYQDVYTMVNSGISFDRYDLGDLNNYHGNTLVQVGRYYGSPSFNVSYSAVTANGFVSNTWQVTQPYDTDTLSRKIWGGVYLSTIEENSLWGPAYQEVVDSSMAYRVLSRNTAFLCLEPNDTLTACEGCGEIEDNNTVGVAETELDGSGTMSLVAKPNPFGSITVLEITLPSQMQGKSITITIVDMLGRMVHKTVLATQAGTDTYQLPWNGQGFDGGNLPAGIYILNVTDGSTLQTIKLVKQQ